MLVFQQGAALYVNNKVNTFWFQQATIFTATLLFQPQLITPMYIQLQIIIYKSSVCCFTHMHIHINVFHEEIFRRAHNIKRLYIIEPFLIRSVSCKRDHVWPSFLSSPLFLSRLTTAVVCFFCLAVAVDMQKNEANLRLYYVDSGTQHHNKIIF